jgi:hypothetical protein
MIRVKGRYRNQKLELDQPLPLVEGTEVEVEIHTVDEGSSAEAEGWQDLGMNRLEAEWDNAQDAVYDDWRRLYGV